MLPGSDPMKAVYARWLKAAFYLYFKTTLVGESPGQLVNGALGKGLKKWSLVII